MSRHANDLQLAQAAAAGDQAAIVAVFERLMRYLEALAPADHPEAACEAFHRALDAIGKYEGRASLRTWAKTILRNVVNGERRRRTRGHEHAIAAFRESGDYIGGDDVFRGIVVSEATNTLDAIALQLPAKYQEVWQASSNGENHESIALSLGIPAGTVWEWLRDAREWMFRQYMKVSRTVIEEAVESGIALAQHGEMARATRNLQVAIHGLARREEKAWVWELRARSWQWLARIEQISEPNPRNYSLMRARAAAVAFEDTLGNADEAIASRTIELGLLCKRNDLAESRAVMETIEKMAREKQLGQRGKKQVARAYALMAGVEGRVGQRSIEECLALNWTAILALDTAGGTADRDVAIVRRAELFIIDGDVDTAVSLLDEAGRTLPERYAAGQALWWNTRHLAAVVARAGDSFLEEAAAKVASFEKRSGIRGYVDGLATRCRLAEDEPGCTDVRRLIRPGRAWVGRVS